MEGIISTKKQTVVQSSDVIIETGVIRKPTGSDITYNELQRNEDGTLTYVQNDATHDYVALGQSYVRFTKRFTSPPVVLYTVNGTASNANMWSFKTGMSQINSSGTEIGYPTTTEGFTTFSVMYSGSNNTSALNNGDFRWVAIGT